MELKVGDIVEHRILRKRKVIVGIQDDKYFCVERNNFNPRGEVQPDSRISIHSGANFYVIGHIPNVAPINPQDMFGRKKVTTNVKPPNDRQTVLIIVIAALTIFVILSSLIVTTRKGVENLLNSKAQSIKEQLKNEIKIK